MTSELAAFLVVFLIFIALYSMYPGVRYLTYSIILLAVGFILFKLLVKQYDEYERGIIFRMGKFNRVAGPGWSIVLPFFEKEFSKLDVRTHMVSISVPYAFTKDDLKLALDGVLYYNIANPDKAVLKIDNYQKALSELIVSEARNVIGNMYMRELFTSLGKLNDLIADAVRHNSWNWGLNVSTVQLKSLVPSNEIVVAMQQKEIEAQQLQAQRFRAEAQKIVVEALGEAAGKLDNRAMMYFYLKALEEVGKGQSTKIVFPMKFFDVMENVGKTIPASLSAAGMSNLKIDDIINSVKNAISAP